MRGLVHYIEMKWVDGRVKIVNKDLSKPLRILLEYLDKHGYGASVTPERIHEEIEQDYRLAVLSRCKSELGVPLYRLLRILQCEHIGFRLAETEEPGTVLCRELGHHNCDPIKNFFEMYMRFTMFDYRLKVYDFSFMDDLGLSDSKNKVFLGRKTTMVLKHILSNLHADIKYDDYFEGIDGPIKNVTYRFKDKLGYSFKQILKMARVRKAVKMLESKNHDLNSIISATNMKDKITLIDNLNALSPNHVKMLMDQNPEHFNNQRKAA